MMRAWFDRLWADMNKMPGPVWIFGGWAVLRLVKWIFYSMPGWIPVGSEMDCSSFWLMTASLVAMIAGQLLALAAAWMLLRRCPTAVSLASLYAGLRAFYLFFGFISPLIAIVPDWAQTGSFGRWPDHLPTMIVEFAVWIGFMVYLNRSKEVAKVFLPQDRRRTPWWLAVVAFVIVGLFGQ